MIRILTVEDDENIAKSIKATTAIYATTAMPQSM